MYKLFIVDLDGCITHPFQSPDWEAISEIKRLNNLSKEDEQIPALTICSGRPFPYVEAVAQWLDVDLPVLFESGAGMYDVNDINIRWHTSFTTERLQEVEEIKKWLKSEIIDKNPGTIPEFTKYTDAGLINREPMVIDKMHRKVLAYIPDNYPAFEVHHTDVSINIITKEANKGKGISWLSDMLGYGLDEVAYIGDSSGDVPALNIVGAAFAPINAKEIAKNAAEIIPKEATEAVLEVYKRLIQQNREAG